MVRNGQGICGEQIFGDGKHMIEIRLDKCKRSSIEYQEIRSRHYIPNNGAVGQQLHYIVKISDGGGYRTVGIISAGSAAYAVGSRDRFFGINKENRQIALNSIVDNTVFRLEERIPNLGTQVLAMWRKRVQKDWFDTYGVKVAGFETFIIESEQRKGAMYKADNWSFVGQTDGSTKFHKHGVDKQFERRETCKKLVFCKWVKGGQLATEYYPSWNNPGIVKGQISMFDIL